eukprot:13019085-Alexandrium_andersonii.AAC.1
MGASSPFEQWGFWVAAASWASAENCWKLSDTAEGVVAHVLLFAHVAPAEDSTGRREVPVRT